MVENRELMLLHNRNRSAFESLDARPDRTAGMSKCASNASSPPRRFPFGNASGWPQ